MIGPRRQTERVIGLEPEHLTDLGNARRLAEMYGQDILYQLPDGPYLTWDGMRFADDAGEVQLDRFAQQTIYAMHADAIYQTELVSELYSTSGDYDLLLKVYIGEDQDIGKFINDHIANIPGIVRSLTTLTFRAF